MRDFRCSIIALICILILAGQGLLCAQQAQTKENGSDVSSKEMWPVVGSSFAQLLNSAETNYKQTHGRFASDTELKKSGAVQDAMTNLMKDLGFESLKNFRWDFHIDTSMDGQSYQLSVYRSSSLECQIAFFNKEDGVIYGGKRIDCQPNLGVLPLKKQDQAVTLSPMEQHYGHGTPKMSTLQDMDHRPFEIGSLRGHWTLLYFWADWCVPCVQEGIPNLIAFAKAHRASEDKFRIVAVHENNVYESGDWNDFHGKTLNLEKEVWHGAPPFPLVYDETTHMTSDWDVHQFPTYALIDPGGNLVREGDLSMLKARVDGH